MLSDFDTIRGLRILVGNAALQIQSLLDAMTIGALGVHEQAHTAKKACELAGSAISEAQPALRRLARKPSGK